MWWILGRTHAAVVISLYLEYLARMLLQQLGFFVYKWRTTSMFCTRQSELRKLTDMAFQL
ncbi:hypothetical protein LINPERPRIM_LOCUS15746 [Linum perenne]